MSETNTAGIDPTDLKDVWEQLKAYSIPRACVGITCSQDGYKELRAAFPDNKEDYTPLGFPPFAGIPVFVKDGQRRPYVAWYDQELLDAYMKNEWCYF